MVASVTSKTSTSSSSSATGPVDFTSAADQQDRFMKLLVAQMKNQDPLNPMDNAQMTSQIAQINTVGGIEKLNATVTSLLSAFTSLQQQSASQLAGRDVLVEGNALELAGGKAVGGVELSAAADTVTVDVLDANGVSVRSLSLGASPAGSRSFSWDGKLADGSQAPEGVYKLRASAMSAGKSVGVKPLTAAQVRAVSYGSDGAATLDLGSGGQTTLDAVRSYL
jgi:flagellar basal-body rod modification protein FlgD